MTIFGNGDLILKRSLRENDDLILIQMIQIRSQVFGFVYCDRGVRVELGNSGGSNFIAPLANVFGV